MASFSKLIPAKASDEFPANGISLTTQLHGFVGATEMFV
jgi:hypothetical protein